MSTRTYMMSVERLDPIRKAVASRDAGLLEALRNAFRDNEDFQSYAEGMIMASEPPTKEPGCWNFLVEPLAEHLGLSPRHLPMDDWKHYYVWEDYRAIADPLVSDSSRSLLRFLEQGRPLVGSSIDHDGSMFGWLTLSETQDLLAELSRIDPDTFGELDEFHEELVECLKQTTDSKAELFVGAC